MDELKSNGLEKVLGEYQASKRFDFIQLIDWEDRVIEPLDKVRLYDIIMADQLLHHTGEKSVNNSVIDYIVRQKEHLVGSMEQDMARVESILKAVIKKSQIDPTTNLPNRNGLYRGLNRILQRSEREEYSKNNKSVAVIFIDGNKIKRVNDVYGHAVGDGVIQYISESLRTVTRPTDMIARWGGDEFVVVLDPIMTSDADAILAPMSNRINSAIKERFSRGYPEIDINSVNLTVSLGMALTGISGYDSSILMENADAAMYHAKKNSKGYHRFDPSMNYEVNA